jgi:hypothetical protein
MQSNKYIGLGIVLLMTQLSFGQKKDETIGTEVVNVVKPYTATISDAFKVKETPSLDDDVTSKKENIQYSIFSFPVASTFTPSKGRAANVDKAEQEKYFNNYATLGLGNYGTINAELFVTQPLENDNYIGARFSHLSSQGGIKDLVLDDAFSETSLDGTYGKRAKDLSYNVDLGFKNQAYNWYGINAALFTPEQINAIDPKHTFNNFYVGGRVEVGESFFKEASVKFNRFFDGLKSGENHFVLKPSFEVEISDTKIKTNVIVDYINGSFEKNYFDGDKIQYGFTNLGINPSFQITSDDYFVNLGATIYYSINNEASKSSFYVYPSINGSYKVVGDLMIAYAGAEGNLKQNSYEEFANTNNFVSPTLGIAPTDQKFDIFVGLKGKLSNSIGYNVRGSYLNEGNKALFLNNQYFVNNTNQEGYAYGNSFDVVYDDIKTISFFGELKADFSKNVSFGVNGTFNSFNVKNQEEAWNLPTIRIGSSLDANITKKWFAGLNIFYIGERKDQFHITGNAITSLPQTITLDSYFDLNANVGYKHNDRLTFFLKGNNLASQNYQRWLNYPVQGVQILGGASYKFDF